MARFEEMRVFAAVVDAGSFVGARTRSRCPRRWSRATSRSGIAAWGPAAPSHHAQLLLTRKRGLPHPLPRTAGGPLRTSDVTMRSMHLGFSSTVTTLSSDDGGVVPVAPTLRALADACLRTSHRQPRARARHRRRRERADAAKAHAPVAAASRLSRRRCAASRPRRRGCDVEPRRLEVLFQQLASVALGMPDPGGAVFADREVAAALLITRSACTTWASSRSAWNAPPLIAGARGRHRPRLPRPVRWTGPSDRVLLHRGFQGDPLQLGKLVDHRAPVEATVAAVLHAPYGPAPRSVRWHR